MSRGSALVAVLVAVLVAGCGASGGSSTDSGLSSSPSAATASATSVPSKLVVTVPSLAGAPSSPVESSAALDTSPVSSAAAEPTSEATAPEEADPTTAAAPEESAAGTVEVTLANCDGCTVIATATGVAGGLSAALIGQNGRALLLSLDASGAVRGASNVPYGSSFPPPADGRLACGADGRCIVVAAADGHAVLSAFQLNADGTWTDLSGTGGFVSATADGLAVPLEGGYAAAIKVSDGSSAVWTVLAWTGAGFGVVGCSADGDSPDLDALALDACLS